MQKYGIAPLNSTQIPTTLKTKTESSSKVNINNNSSSAEQKIYTSKSDQDLQFKAGKDLYQSNILEMRLEGLLIIKKAADLNHKAAQEKLKEISTDWVDEAYYFDGILIEPKKWVADINNKKPENLLMSELNNKLRSNINNSKK